MYVWLNFETIKFYLIKFVANFKRQPRYILGEATPLQILDLAEKACQGKQLYLTCPDTNAIKLFKAIIYECS